jgi:hypothetical protein
MFEFCGSAHSLNLLRTHVTAQAPGMYINSFHSSIDCANRDPKKVVPLYRTHCWPQVGAAGYKEYTVGRVRHGAREGPYYVEGSLINKKLVKGLLGVCKYA